MSIKRLKRALTIIIQNHSGDMLNQEDNIGVSPLKDKGKLVSNTILKTKILLDHFKSVFTLENGSPLPSTDDIG